MRRLPLMMIALSIASCSIASCSKPRELGGQYTGDGNETFDRGAKSDVFNRAPRGETVTVMRGAGDALRIRYGSCELPATMKPDHTSATLDDGATCTVNGVAGVPIRGTFSTSETAGGGLSVDFAGGSATADGKTTYSYKFTGTRLLR